MKTIINIFTFIALVSITSAFDLTEHTFKILIKKAADETDRRLEREEVEVYRDLTEDVRSFIPGEVEKKKEREWKLVLGFAPNSFHFRELDRLCNQTNNIIQVGIERKGYTLSYNNFTNTFGQHSDMVMLDRKFGKKWYTKIGFGIVKGYKKEGKYIYKVEQEDDVRREYFVMYNNHFVIHNDVGIVGIVGAGYSTKYVDFEIDMLGLAITGGVKVKI